MSSISLSSSRRTNSPLLPFAIAIIAFVVTWYFMYEFTVDDAYISFRYAKHFAEGYGLVFNPGERVEGYSNPSWVMLLAAGFAMGFDMLVLSKVLGLIAGAAAIIFAQRIAREHFSMDALGTTFVGLTLAVSSLMAYNAAAGLETTLYTAIVVSLAYYLLRVERGGAQHDIVKVSLLLAAAIMTRPEAPLLALPSLYIVWRSRRRFGDVVTLAIAPSATFIALEIFRLSYFDSLFPNTFTAKVGTDAGIGGFIVAHTAGFVTYTIKSFREATFVAILAAAGLFLTKQRVRSIVAVITTIAFFVWYAGGDWMSFSRFYIPILPLLMVCAFVGLSLLMWKRHEVEEEIHSRSPDFVRCMVFALPAIFSLGLFSYDVVTLRRNQEHNPAMTSITLGHLANHVSALPLDCDTIAAVEIGALGLKAERYIIDAMGLTDKRIAGYWSRSELDSCAQYIVGKRPDVIIIYDRQRSHDTIMHPLHQGIFDRLTESAAYLPDTIISLNSYKHAMVFRRRW